jgi:hypothetical protein
MVRRELQLVGLDLGMICAGPTANGTVKTDLYTITRSTTMGSGGRRRPGRQIVTVEPGAIERLEAVLGDSWPTRIAAPVVEDDDDNDDREGDSPSRYKVLAEQQYEAVEPGESARYVMSFLESTRVVLDVGAFRKDLLIAKTQQTELIQELRKRGISTEPPKTKAEGTARRIAVYVAAKKRTSRAPLKWRRTLLRCLKSTTAFRPTYGPSSRALPRLRPMPQGALLAK